MPPSQRADLNERVAMVETVADRNREDISHLSKGLNRVENGLAHLSERVGVSISTTGELKDDLKAFCRTYGEFVVKTTSQQKMLSVRQKIIYATAGGIISAIVALVSVFLKGV